MASSGTRGSAAPTAPAIRRAWAAHAGAASSIRITTRRSRFSACATSRLAQKRARSVRGLPGRTAAAASRTAVESAVHRPDSGVEPPTTPCLPGKCNSLSLLHARSEIGRRLAESAALCRRNCGPNCGPLPNSKSRPRLARMISADNILPKTAQPYWIGARCRRARIWPGYRHKSTPAKATGIPMCRWSHSPLMRPACLLATHLFHGHDVPFKILTGNGATRKAEPGDHDPGERYSGIVRNHVKPALGRLALETVDAPPYPTALRPNA